MFSKTVMELRFQDNNIKTTPKILIKMIISRTMNPIKESIVDFNHIHLFLDLCEFFKLFKFPSTSKFNINCPKRKTLCIISGYKCQAPLSCRSRMYL